MVKKQKLDSVKLGYAAGIWSAGFMLALGILANLGFYTGAAQKMQEWHMFFSIDPVGIFTGMIEAAVMGFLLIYTFAWIYNKL